jgi:hypothetical protein
MKIFQNPGGETEPPIPAQNSAIHFCSSVKFKLISKTSF